MLLAIVQARLSSKRLPNKVLLKVCGKPLIEYLFDRLKKVKKIDKIILATSNSTKDDELIKFSNNLNIETFRGSEKDVLERFYKAAKYFKADKILRITGDCPLISPKIINRLIKYFSTINIDYAYTSERFAEGLDCEIFTYNALKKTYLSAKKQSEREHITQYIKNNPKKFKISSLHNKKDESIYRITVDEKQDFKVVKSIIENFNKKKLNFYEFDEIKKFLDLNINIKNINKKIMRNQGLYNSLLKD